MEPHSEKKGGLRGKFEGFTHSPSDAVWERIAAQPTDRPLGASFRAFTWVPRGRVWRRIAAELHPGQRMRAIAGWSAAAGVALLLGVGIWWQGQDEDVTGKSLADGQWKQQWNADHDFTQRFGHSQGRNTQPASGENALQDGSQFAARPSMNPPHRIPSTSPHHPQENLVIAEGPRKLEATAMENLNARDAFVLGEQPDEIERKLLFWRNLELEAAKERRLKLEEDMQAFLNASEKAEPVFVAQAGSNLSGGNAGFGPRVLKFDDVSNADQFPFGLGQFESASDYKEDTRENFKTPLAFGLMVDHPLSRRLGVSGGLVYTRMESYRDGEGGPFTQRLDVTRQYLGLAANGSYSIPFSRRITRWAMYVNAGLQYDFGLRKHTELRTRLGETLVEAKITDTHSGNQVNANMGLGVRYALLKRVGVYAQGTVAHYFIQTQDNLWSTKPFWPMAQMGVRVVL